ncbi:alginate O-acetyltransferase [Desulfovibrio sp. X2]|uniref:alginate O-acetyltransferase AlgX-related protein n=1 Tax=Desulfovibrio sp. X2 TaxID=941449 RepID=UPI000358CABD|nr:alginate O-acetyltransferase [Desulfovibrio sp. X2]EPR39793.1 alginate O-acetyltransferase [Desulfovibrio sp. X2]
MRKPSGQGLGGILLALLFLAAVFPPLMGFFTDLHAHVSLTEKRELAPFPGIPASPGALRAFPGAFEKYFGDRFGLRQPMISLHNWIEITFFKPDSSTRVVKGRDGWYYLHQSIGYCTRQKPLDQAQLAQWAETLAARRDFLAARGVTYLFVVAPSKPGIYPEHLPPDVRPAEENALDQLSAYIAGLPGRVPPPRAPFPPPPPPDIPFLDLRPELRQAARQAQVYETTDTHWNDRGALVAALRIADALRERGVFLPPPPPFRETVQERNGGDLAQMLGLQYVLRGTAPLVEPVIPGAVKRIVPDYMSRAWSYYPPTVWEKRGLPGHLVMIGDSFTMSTACSSFLAEFFGRSVAVHRDLLPPDAEGLERIVQAEHPDVVVEEIVERNLVQPVSATQGLLARR